ncbi:MAG: sensor histidine kinase [Planctomycetota bacterium]|nr:sensor histidine kinase [Planctomycetota bacterium]
MTTEHQALNEGQMLFAFPDTAGLKGPCEAERSVPSTTHLASTGSPECESHDCRELASEAVQMALATKPIEHQDNWDIQVLGAPLTCGAEPTEVRQALRNLVLNALDMQPNGGQVIIHIQQEDNSIVFSVEDSGPGVAPDVAHRVFEPFFTTRAEGTGLGLALVRSIAELHGGHLQLDPNPSPLGGACFHFSLSATG